jgi:predicted nucleotidyltransferase component of viral defense system
MNSSKEKILPSGVWEQLLPHALKVIEDIKTNLIKVETGTEIVAKKLWHRGDRATARDLFDLALVIEKEADALRQAHHFLVKNADQFIEQLNSRREILTVQFNNIETLTYNPTYDEALKIATKFLKTLK